MKAEHKQWLITLGIVAVAVLVVVPFIQGTKIGSTVSTKAAEYGSKLNPKS